MLPVPFSNPTTYYDVFHAGIDFPVREGTPIPALGNGTVKFVGVGNRDSGNSAGPGRKAGISRVIQYDNGVEVRWAHLKNTDGPQRGERVSRGDFSGYVGNTGYSFGAHLHMEVWVNGSLQAGTNFWRYVNRNDVAQLRTPGAAGSDAAKPFPTPAPSTRYPMEDNMIRIQAPNRGIALVGPGYYRSLRNNEEVAQSDMLVTPPGGTPWHYTGNDRQFDLWVSMALSGQMAEPVTTRDASQAANKVATEVRNLITDPNKGLLQAITKVSVDSTTIAAAIQAAMKDVKVTANVDAATIEKIANRAVDRLVERATS